MEDQQNITIRGHYHIGHCVPIPAEKNIFDEVRDAVLKAKTLRYPPPKRLILGVNKRTQLIYSLGLFSSDTPDGGGAEIDSLGDGTERFMGLEILVDMGNVDRVEVE